LGNRNFRGTHAPARAPPGSSQHKSFGNNTSFRQWRKRGPSAPQIFQAFILASWAIRTFGEPTPRLPDPPTPHNTRILNTILQTGKIGVQRQRATMPALPHTMAEPARTSRGERFSLKQVNLTTLTNQGQTVFLQRHNCRRAPLNLSTPVSTRLDLICSLRA
jgi:hypothetical protein